MEPLLLLLLKIKKGSIVHEKKRSVVEEAGRQALLFSPRCDGAATAAGGALAARRCFTA